MIAKRSLRSISRSLTDHRRYRDSSNWHMLYQIIPNFVSLRFKQPLDIIRLKSTAPHEFDSHKRLRFFLCATVVTRWWYQIFHIIISHSWQLRLYVCLNECNKFPLHFFNMMRKINALYLCNNIYWSQCFFLTKIIAIYLHHQRSRIREKLPCCLCRCTDPKLCLLITHKIQVLQGPFLFKRRQIKGFPKFGEKW